MARYTLISSDFGIGYELFPASKRLACKYEKETGHESVLIQTDWDFPGLAQSLGWSLRRVQKYRRKPCEHTGTDGTVKCKECGLEAGYFIDSAREWLDKHCDRTFNDRFGSIGMYFGD